MLHESSCNLCLRVIKSFPKIPWVFIKLKADYIMIQQLYGCFHEEYQ